MRINIYSNEQVSITINFVYLKSPDALHNDRSAHYVRGPAVRGWSAGARGR